MYHCGTCFSQCESGHAKLVSEIAKNMGRMKKEEYPRLQSAIDQTTHFVTELAKLHQNMSHQVSFEERVGDLLGVFFSLFLSARGPTV